MVGVGSELEEDGGLGLWVVNLQKFKVGAPLCGVLDWTFTCSCFRVTNTTVGTYLNLCKDMLWIFSMLPSQQEFSQ